uniref:Putative ABC transporter permease protein n=1 Tax=Streptomyces sp. A7248 TaxID=1233308 RepID=K9M8G8_9ACTN|nr:putative ABC transporter permease protein [Streptomyces sp. A7248]
MARARAVEGAVVSVSRTTAVTVLEEDTALVSSPARAVDPARLAAVSELPVTAGRLAGLDDGAIVVNEEWLTTRVGDRVTVWLGDGRETSLVNLLVVWGALVLLGVPTVAVVVPWGTLGLVVAAAALLAAVSAVLPAALALGTRPVELAGARE